MLLSRAGSRGWSWQNSPEIKMPTCSWVCKELSALQVSYGFVFPTSGDSTVALRHWNLSQVSVLVFTCNSFWNSWLKDKSHLLFPQIKPSHPSWEIILQASCFPKNGSASCKFTGRAAFVSPEARAPKLSPVRA